MLSRVIQAAIAGAVAFLVCIFVGMLLAATGIPIADAIGAFLTTWAAAIAILVALAAFFGGPTFLGRA